MSLINRFKALRKLIGYCFSSDFRRTLQIIIRQQGEVTNFYNLSYQIEKYPILNGDNNLIPLLERMPYRIKRSAIVLQGPIWHDDSFTLNTCRLYRSLYPEVKIYLSVWNDEVTEQTDSWHSLGVVLIKSPRPKILNELGSLQFQTTLIHNALSRAKQDGIEWVFKGRCDQRMLNPYFLHGFLYYSSLMDSRVSRLTFGLHDSLFYIPYKVNDQFMFGPIDLLMSYWNKEYDCLINIEKSAPSAMAGLSPEQLLFARFLQEDKCLELDFTLTQYHESCGRFIAFTDEGSESVLWIKYPYRFKPHWSFNNRIWRQWNWLEWQYIASRNFIN